MVEAVRHVWKLLLIYPGWIVRLLTLVLPVLDVWSHVLVVRSNVARAVRHVWIGKLLATVLHVLVFSCADAGRKKGQMYCNCLLLLLLLRR